MPVDVWQRRPLRTESSTRGSDPEPVVETGTPAGGPSMGIDAPEVARSERERELGRQEPERGSELAHVSLPWIGFARPRHGWLTRAYRHDGPLFRQRLLAERWLAERDVVLMAALRPSTEEMLLTIARDDRWFFRARVREALCNNPYTPSWLVASLLPAVSGTTRRRLTGHRDPRVAALAEAWAWGPVARRAKIGA
ncbi:MAG TPA: hypothetical protein ENK57_24310 [Polyangiaceae bacterium]|nr:hypothetical protein [Polyangiaceae bacterium]